MRLDVLYPAAHACIGNVSGIYQPEGAAHCSTLSSRNKIYSGIPNFAMSAFNMIQEMDGDGLNRQLGISMDQLHINQNSTDAVMRLYMM